jgi:hypothetical protein
VGYRNVRNTVYARLPPWLGKSGIVPGVAGHVRGLCKEVATDCGVQILNCSEISHVLAKEINLLQAIIQSVSQYLIQISISETELGIYTISENKFRVREF